MPVLTLTTYVSTAPGLSGAMITDLEIQDPGGGVGPTLYVTTGYNGSISAWDLNPTGPIQINNSKHNRTDVPGTVACLGFINTSQGLAVLSGGGSKGALVLRDLDASGGLGTQTSLGTLPTLAGDLIATITVTLSSGSQMVYGGLAGASGVGQLSFSTTGALTGSGVTSDTASASAGRVVALAEVKIGGQQYLFTASSQDVGVTCWTVSPTGALVEADSLNSGNGLWIGTPTAMEVVEVTGKIYIVLAAAGSNTISLIAVASDGSMQVTDNVMDDLNSRFAGATAITVVEHGGQSYVVAGGGDDGISLYQILPGGTFLAVAHLADTASMGLSDVSAIAAQSTVTGIEIFVGSSSETGITQLKYDPGVAGLTMQSVASGSSLTGGNNNDVMVGATGNDRLTGGNGADILMDGAGSDTLSGGSGADTFVLSADGQTDTVSDFTLGSDKLDLSAWSMLRGVSQLYMVATPTGMTISFGNEVLVVNSSTGGSINPASLTEADLLNLTRIQVVIPDLPAPPKIINGTTAADALNGESGGDQLSGGWGNDELYGAGGTDVLYGGGGNDRVDGGPGSDFLIGSLGDDSYVVDSTGDWVQQEVRYRNHGGIDTVNSWVSYALPFNLEFLRLQGDEDLDGTGRDLGSDGLVGNSGDNVLDGLGSADGINGGAGNDTLIGGQGRDWLFGDEGADVFMFSATTESGPGWQARDMIEGFEAGLDQINLFNIDANTVVAGDQGFSFIGTTMFSGQGSASAGQLRACTWNGGNFVLVEMDVNGDAVADMQIMITGITTVSASDFIL